MRGNNPEYRLPDSPVRYEQFLTESRKPHLRKGDPLAIVTSITISPKETIHMAMTVTHTTIPFDVNNIPEENDVDLHVRSRWAHLGIHVGDYHKALAMYQFKILTLFPSMDNLVTTLPVTNLGNSPVKLAGGILHFFHQPPGSRVEGKELEDMFTDHPQLGEAVVLGQEDGQITHAYVKASEDRFVIPAQEEPIAVADFQTFEDVRDYLYGHYFQQVDPEEIETDQLFVAAMPQIDLPVGRYIIVGQNAYTRMPNGNFVETGIHLRSPLVEARSNPSGHNLELVNGEWVRIAIVKNGTELVAG